MYIQKTIKNADREVVMVLGFHKPDQYRHMPLPGNKVQYLYK